MSASASANPTRRAPWRRGSAPWLILAVLTAPPAAAQVTYAGSVRAATGSYLFTESTTSVYVLSAVEVETGRVRLSGSVPLVYQSTPWITYAGAIVPSGGPQSSLVGDQIRRGAGGSTGGSGTGSAQPGGARLLTPASTWMLAGPTTAATVPAGFTVTLPEQATASRTGVGDPILRGSYRFTQAGADTVVRAGAVVKPALATVDRGFGTGAADYGAGLTLVHQRDVHQLSASAEFWSLGDLPDLPLNSALSYRIGYERSVLSQRWYVSGAIAGWTRILDGVAPPTDLTVGFGRYDARSGRSVGATVSFGLTNASPDVSIGLDWRLPL